MHARTQKVKLEISSRCLQSVRTNSLAEHPINTRLRHTHTNTQRLKVVVLVVVIMFSMPLTIKIISGVIIINRQVYQEQHFQHIDLSILKLFQ